MKLKIIQRMGVDNLLVDEMLAKFDFEYEKMSSRSVSFSYQMVIYLMNK